MAYVGFRLTFAANKDLLASLKGLLVIENHWIFWGGAGSVPIFVPEFVALE